MSVDPAVVTIIGEPQPLGAVEALDTEAVDLAGATDPFTRQVTVQAPSGVSLARAEPLTLAAQISPVNLRQTLRVPVTVQGVSGDLFLASGVPVVTITASGATDQGLSASDVRAIVDASGLSEGAYTLPVRMTLPDRYQLEDVTPNSARVVLQGGQQRCAYPRCPRLPSRRRPSRRALHRPRPPLRRPLRTRPRSPC